MTDKPNIGVLALTLEFYEQLAPDLRRAREKFLREKLMPLLSEVAHVHFEKAVYRREDIEWTVRGYEAKQVDVLLVVMLTYSPSLITAPALKRTHLPIVIWNTQELRGVDENYGDAELLANHGVHATQDLCNVLNRHRVHFQYVTSHADDPQPLGQLPTIFRASRAVRKLRNARLGLMGYPFPGMGDLGFDPTHLANTLGCTSEMLSLDDYHNRVQQAAGAEIDRLVNDYRNQYEVGADVAREDMEATARGEAALRGIVKDHRLDAFSYQFLAFGQDERTETVPFVGASRLLGEGIGFGGEGDLLAAAHSALSAWIHPPAGFSEIFTIDFEGNSLLLSHMGEANPAMGRWDRKVRLVRRKEPIVPVRGNQLALVFSYEPGPATLSTLTLGPDARWRIIAAAVEIVDFGPLEHLAVPHSKVRPDGDVRDFLNAYAQAGGPHHLALSFGDARGELASVAEFVGADYVEI